MSPRRSILALAAFMVAGCDDAPSGSVVGTRTGGLGVPVALAAGANETCAVVMERSGPDGGTEEGAGGDSTTGELQCWGLESGTPRIPRGAPAEVRDGASGSLGGEDEPTRCVVDGDRQVVCWGSNPEGQTGQPPATATNPRAVGGLPPALRVEVGVDGRHSCALTTEGLYCWGANSDGQLGDGSRSSGPLVRRVALASVSAFALGGRHSCAVAAGELHCWGADEAGQAGGSYVGAPSRILLRTPAVAVAAGRTHTCVLDGEGAVHCFGANARGQLGREPDAGGPRPVTVSVREPIAHLAAGVDHTCAAGERSVECWGANGRWQTGSQAEGEGIVRSTPLRASALALGAAHSCAISGTRVYCWGDGATGQLGGGDVDRSAQPRVIPNLR